MKETFCNYWSNLKRQPDIWLFFGFILTFTLSVRKVIFFFPIQKTFNEYTGIYLYASDIMLILTLIVVGFFILRNNIMYLSRYKIQLHNLLNNLYLSIPAFLVLLSFLSISWSQNQTIAAYRSIKLLEAYFFYLYIAFKFIPAALFHVEQSEKHPKNQLSTIVPRGTISKHYSCDIYNRVKHALLQINSPTIQKENGLNKAIHSAAGTFELKTDTQTAINTPINVPRGTLGNHINLISNCSTWNNFIKIIILLGLSQSIIAIWQFILQHSIGLFWLKESLIYPNTPGVAKLILNGHKYIRAYGLFPHPNILGGFLLFSIIITLLYKNTFHINCSTCLAGRRAWNNSIKQENITLQQMTGIKFSWSAMIQKLFHVEQIGKHSFKNQQSTIVPRGTIATAEQMSKGYFCSQKLIIKKIWLIYSILWLQIIALFLTFSKSAIIGLLIALAYIKLFHVEQFKNDNLAPASSNNYLNCSTWNNCIYKKLFQAYCQSNKRMFHVEHSKKIMLAGLIIISLIFIFKPNFSVLFLQSLEERSFYLNVSRGTILTNPLLGIGNGQFVLRIPEYTKKTVEIWQFQPVHNIYLLMWNELGIVGLGLFICLLWKLFHVEQLEITPDSESIVPPASPAGGRGTIGRNETGRRKENYSTGESVQNNSILCNNCNALSIETILRYSQGILLGFLFIGLFDHYFWDIWPGQILFWLVMGVIVGIRTKLNNH